MTRVVVHIGTGKTGTSAIQSYLHHHRAALLDQGVDYPEHGLSVVDHFGEPIAAHYPLCDWLLRSLDDRLTQWRRALSKRQAHTVILSCENFYHRLEAGHIADLHTQLKDFDVRILCYVRPQDSFMASAWKQQVKVGELRQPFPAFLERHCSPEFLAQSHANYHRMLAPWSAVFGESALALRVFDRDTLTSQGGLIEDFLGACGLRLNPALPSEPPPTRNEALPSELLLLLRQINGRKAVPAGQQAALVKFLRQFRFDDPPLLNARERRAVLQNYLACNQALFQQYGNQPVPACFLLPSPEGGSEETAAPTRLPRIEDIAVNCLMQAWENSKGTELLTPQAGTAPALAAPWKKWLGIGAR